MKVYSTICSLLILVVPWCMLSSFASPQEEGLTETPASNEDPEMKEVGERPYEMADRKQEHRPQFDFENLGGWRAACRDGARAKLVRTREQQMWGRFVGKLTYQGKSKKSEVEIIPPKPIPIPDDATAVNLWIFSDDDFHRKDVTRAVLSVRIEDARGKLHGLTFRSLQRVSCRYWFLAHKRLPKIPRPAKFVSLVLKNCSNSKPKRLYLDSLSFYNEALKPLEFKYTLQQIKKTVPFPTTPDTILPPSPVSYQNSARQEGNRYVFSCKGSDDTLEYRYEPRTGTLSDLTVIHGGRRTFQPAAGGGPVLFAKGREFRPDDPSVTRKLLESELADGTLRTRWRYSVGNTSAEVDMNFRIKNRSLIVDFESVSADFAGLGMGHSAGTPGAKTIQVPYMTFFSATEPYVLYWRGLFVSSMLDWYNSDASELYGGSGKVSGESASYNGGSKYIPRSDGVRNPLCERLFITVSPTFSDVLPNIPNPASPLRDVTAPRLFVRLIDASSLPALRTYKAYGLDKLFVRFHEPTWRDGGDGFTFKLQGAPEKGGDAGLKRLVAEVKRLVAEVKKLGYDRVGLYTAYTAICTTNANFSSNDIALLPDGNWNQRCWPRMYSYKSMRAVQMQEELAPEIHRKFGTTGSYTDVATCISPWRRLDYDARVPGAGMFASWFYPFGKLLLNERKAHEGPVFSEGTMHWMYAGLADGNYGEIRLRGKKPWQVPFLLDFDLLRIHPLEADCGPGPLGICPAKLEGVPDYIGPTDTAPFRSSGADRVLAATIAFGHTGFLGHIAKGDHLWRSIKTYYMIQQLQERYIMVPVAEIRYNDNGKLVTTSEAIATDAYKQSQVYVKYANGMEVYVNGSWDKPWRVSVGGNDYLLPPAGFVAAKPDELLVYSAEVDGKRVDYVRSPEYVYADARGKSHAFPELETDGAVAIKRNGDSLTAIIASPDATKLAIDVGRLLPRPIPDQVIVEARDVKGNVIRQGKFQLTAGRMAGSLEEKAISYHIMPLGNRGKGR